MVINYSNKLFIKYPNFSSSILGIYEFVLRKYSYESKENIEYFLKLNGIKKGIIYIVDSHSSKVPISLYYSALNKFKRTKILGIYFNEDNIYKINNISNEYDTIDLDFKSIIKNNKVIDNKIFTQLEQYKSQGFTINLWINEYYHFRNYKRYKKLLNLVNHLFVFNEEIKNNLIKYKKINHSLIKVVDIINYHGLINSYKTNIYYNNKLLDKSKKYTLHINSLKDSNSYEFAKELILKNRESKLFSALNKLIIIISYENMNTFENKKRIRKLFKEVENEDNIIIMKEQFFGWFGKNYYYSVFKNIDNFIIYDNNIFYHEYIVLANTIKFNIFYKKEFSEDLSSYPHKHLFKAYEDLSEKLKINTKTIEKTSNDLSFYDIKFSNKILKETTFSNKKIILSESHNIAYNYELLVIRIIGNDLPPLHNSSQTLLNIEFIIKNEKLPNSSKRLWIINRLINNKKSKEIINLLDQYKENYKIINYEKKILKSIGFEDFQHSKNIFNREVFFYLKSKYKFLNKILINFNKYIMNNNGARNFALKIGKEEKVKWILPLDGNIFIPSSAYKNIKSDIRSNNFNYLLMPMARIENFDEINNPNKLDYCEEPQIGFRYESDITFNENYVYGSRSKVELLQKLQILDRWGSVNVMLPNNLEEFNIDSGNYFDYKYSGGLIRLPAFNKSNNFSPEQLLQQRSLNRDKAIYYTIRDNIVREFKGNLKLSLSIYNQKNINLISSKYIDEIKKPFVSVLDKPFPIEIINYYSHHDYLSFAPYCWPNKLKEDDLPSDQIEREWNLECILISKESKSNDRKALQTLFDRVTSLSLLYKKNKDERILDYIAKQISYWFINDQTKMNPHLKFANIIKGNPNENDKGLIDFKDIYYFLSAIKLIEEDLSKVQNFDLLYFKYWLIEYYSWLTNSNIARKKTFSLNYHKTFYLLQKAAIESYMGMENNLFETFVNTFVFINNNIYDNSNQKERLKRKTFQDYCCFNIQQILNINSIFINSLNMNLFDFYGNKQNNIIKCIICLYDRKDKWNHQQIDSFEIQSLHVLFHMAVDQSEKIGAFIDKKQLRRKDKIYDNFDYKYGIPLHWKIL